MELPDYITIEWIRLEVGTDFETAKRALLAIYKMQSEKEKRSVLSIGKDGFGFSSFDTKFLTECVFKIMRNQYMSEKEKSYMKLKVARYSKQIHRLMKNDPNIILGKGYGNVIE